MVLNLAFKIAFLMKMAKNSLRNDKFPVYMKMCLVHNLGQYSSNLETFFKTHDAPGSHGTE